MTPFEILIVEDSKVQRLGLKSILEGAGYVTRMAEDGVAGLAALEESRPDLIVSDVVMPELDGYEFSRAAKLKWPRLPIILLTSLTDPQDIVRGLECGADNYISKPYEAQQLLARVEHMRVNSTLRDKSDVQAGIQIQFAGKRRFLNSTRLQILDHLLSSYEDAVHQTSALREANERLRVVHGELESKNAALEQSISDLAELNREKNTLLGTVSHDLRNPLGVIRSYAQLMREGRITGAQAGITLARIEDRSNFMLQMVDGLLDASAIESGTITLDLKWVDLRATLESNLIDNRLLAARAGVDLVFEMPPTNYEVLIDTNRFEQVLNNLIGNAIRFSPKGGSVSVGLLPPELGVVVTVSDEGPGVSPDQAKLLFEPYTRGSRVAGKSTGLGLAIAQRVVLEHDGEIWVEPSDSGGARFCVRLPADGVRAPPVSSAAESAPEGPAA